MCAVTELLQESLSTENILKYIDDYSIYSHYIGKELELGTRYSSPIRKGDDNPSFSLFQGRDGKIFFKDHATTFKGDVFNFVRILMSDGNPNEIPFPCVLQQIDNDFNLGLYTENSNLPKLILKKILSDIPKKEKYSISITSKLPSIQFINYWKEKYDIEQPVLNLYNCKEVETLHYISSNNHKVITPKTLCISYQIGGRFKIYFPFECKANKFKNDFPQNWVEGMLQLKYDNDFIIITKAMKEVMFFRQHFDWDTVAGKSETTMIPKHLMDKLFKSYKHVFIWLDKDKTGIEAQNKYIEKYPGLIPLTYPEHVQEKDVTDRYEFLKKTGLAKIALQEIDKIVKDGYNSKHN